MQDRSVATLEIISRSNLRDGFHVIVLSMACHKHSTRPKLQKLQTKPYFDCNVDYGRWARIYT